MKEFSKSIASAGIASLLFGVRQLSNVAMTPPRSGESDKATEAFNVLAQAAAGQCGDSMRETFHAMDRIQREAIETGFRFLSLDAFNSHGVNESVSGFARQTTDQFRRWMGDRTDCNCDSWSTMQDEPDQRSEPENDRRTA